MVDEFEDFLSRSVNIFRDAPRDPMGLRQALLAYLHLGRLMGLSQGELIDHLGVSTPSILELSGFEEVHQDVAMAILGSISDAEISK